MRGRAKRTWVKLHITGWLHGSIRWQLEPSERSVWADLICLAGECGQGGRVCDNDGQPLPRSFVANQLNIPQELLDTTIAKCKHEGRLEDDDNVIIITNWVHYQSEYERVKKYRGQDGKKVYAEFVYLTDKEYSELVKRFGKTSTDERIESLALHIGSKGDKYKSHYHTILNWERMDAKRNGTHKGHTNSDSIGKPIGRTDWGIGKPLD